MARSCKGRATVICYRDEKVLLVRKPKAKWVLPGGKIEPDEAPIEAAARELSEETGMTSEALAFIGIHKFEGRSHHVFQFSVPGSIIAQPQNEIADCQWFSLQDLGCESVKRPSIELLKLYGEPSVKPPDTGALQ